MARELNVAAGGGWNLCESNPYLVLLMDSGGVIVRRMLLSAGRSRGGEGNIAPCTEPSALGKLLGGVIDRTPAALPGLSIRLVESIVSLVADSVSVRLPGRGTMPRRL